MKKSEAIRLRKIIEGAMQNIDDKTASEGAMLFPKLKYDGSLIQTGTRINWHGLVKRAAVDLWDTVENNPGNAPNLWHNIEYLDGLRVLKEAIPTTNPVQVDEICWYNGVKYKNILGIVNTYLPDVYPAGWERIEDN